MSFDIGWCIGFNTYFGQITAIFDHKIADIADAGWYSQRGQFFVIEECKFTNFCHHIFFPLVSDGVGYFDSARILPFRFRMDYSY